MRINSIPPKDLLYQYVHVREKQAPTVEPSVHQDRVELTGGAKSFSAALKVAKDQLETGNSDRVAQIKQQIQQNTYSVPAMLVAEKMLGKQ